MLHKTTLNSDADPQCYAANIWLLTEGAKKRIRVIEVEQHNMRRLPLYSYRHITVLPLHSS